MLPRIYLHNTPRQTCTECGAFVKWEQAMNMQWIPVNPDGTLHKCEDNGGDDQHQQDDNDVRDEG